MMEFKRMVRYPTRVMMKFKRMVRYPTHVMMEFKRMVRSNSRNDGIQEEWYVPTHVMMEFKRNGPSRRYTSRTTERYAVRSALGSVSADNGGGSHGLAQ